VSDDLRLSIEPTPNLPHVVRTACECRYSRDHSDQGVKQTAGCAEQSSARAPIYLW